MTDPTDLLAETMERLQTKVSRLEAAGVGGLLAELVTAMRLEALVNLVAPPGSADPGRLRPGGRRSGRGRRRRHDRAAGPPAARCARPWPGRAGMSDHHGHTTIVVAAGPDAAQNALWEQLGYAAAGAFEPGTFLSCGGKLTWSSLAATITFDEHLGVSLGPLVQVGMTVVDSHPATKDLADETRMALAMGWAAGFASCELAHRHTHES